MAPPPTEDEDTRLVQRCQSGDLDAFDQLVMKHQATITGLLFRFARETDNLEDMVQETFVRAWRGLASWKPERPFVHWLKRIAVRVGLEFCRKHQRSPFSRLREPPAEDAADPLNAIPVAEDSALAARAAGDEAHFILAQLPPQERAVLTLLYLDEMPLAEIAAHFGWSAANAKIKAFRARKKLRTILHRHGYTS